jgi:hypothetical protein
MLSTIKKILMDKLSIRSFGYQLTIDKPTYQLNYYKSIVQLIVESLLLIVDKIWNLTNEVPF